MQRAAGRRVCAVVGLAIAASLAGGPALADARPAAAGASSDPVAAYVDYPTAIVVQAAPRADDRTQAGTEHARSTGNGDPRPGSEGGSLRGDGTVVDELQDKLADPMLLIVGPSASHGLSFQEGDSRYPAPFDGALDGSTKAVLGSGSTRSSKSKAPVATADGDQPHWPVNLICSSRVNHTYGSSNNLRPNNGAAMRQGCAANKVLPQPHAPRRATAPIGANDAAAESAADAGEDDSSDSPAARPDNVTVGQIIYWYVPLLGTVVTLPRVIPEDPPFSPD